MTTTTKGVESGTTSTSATTTLNPAALTGSTGALKEENEDLVQGHLLIVERGPAREVGKEIKEAASVAIAAVVEAHDQKTRDNIPKAEDCQQSRRKKVNQTMKERRLTMSLA